MIEVGLTGGIGCGKSTVSGMLRGLGALIIDADELARESISPGGAAYDKAVAEFGRRILGSDGRVDRAALAAIVFSDPEKRRRLEAIVHPAVFAMEAGMMALFLEKHPDRIAVFDAALLIESGAHTRMDKVVVVWCSPETQMRRLVEKKGLDREQARLRVEAQMPLDEKLPYADFVIDNDGPLEDTQKQVENLFEKLKLYV